MLKPSVLLIALSCLALPTFAAQNSQRSAQTQIDKDLFEVTIAKLESLYASHTYTVTQVVQWHLARIHKYNGVYRPIEQILEADALATAAREDAEPSSSKHGPLWGVPIVIKANTSIQGQVTTDGWIGYTLAGHELIAPKDATVVTRLRAAGAILVGHTNMPDFAASDTNRSSSFGRTGNAYDVRFSPGGSSGGTVTAVTSNMAVLGNGTDYWELDSHACGDFGGDRSFPDARIGVDCRDCSAGLVAGQHRANRPRCNRCNHRSRCDGWIDA